MRLLDLFCGRWGWSRAFAARGWECVGVDLQEPPEVPDGCCFMKGDVLEIKQLRGIPGGACDYSLGESWDFASASQKDYWIGKPFDFIVASSPCEEFSVWGMKHFHPNPPWPHLGITLFNHTQTLCETSGVPYVMENVKAAQRFIGKAVHHCGAFHLWGNAVPPLLPRNIWKGWEHKYVDRNGRKRGGGPGRYEWSPSEGRREAQAKVATIPPELAACVAEYAERILEQRAARTFQPCGEQK